MNEDEIKELVEGLTAEDLKKIKAEVVRQEKREKDYEKALKYFSKHINLKGIRDTEFGDLYHEVQVEFIETFCRGLVDLSLDDVKERRDEILKYIKEDIKDKQELYDDYKKGKVLK